jgi:hypothetical protein
LPGHPKFQLLLLPSDRLDLLCILLGLSHGLLLSLAVPVGVSDPAVEEVVELELAQPVGAVLEEHAEPGTDLLVVDIP